MRRIFHALAEWLALRARLRNERRFHIDRAAADFRALGLSRRAAQRLARSRFGPRRHLRLALREIGGDSRGLLELLRAHRVLACAWPQPAALLAAAALFLLLSPARLLILESIVCRPLASHGRQTVFLSVSVSPPLSPEIPAKEFNALRSLPGLSHVERYETFWARGEAAAGVSAFAIQSEARIVTGDPRIRAVTRFDEQRIFMGPALAAWIVFPICAVFSLRTRWPAFGRCRWLFYATLTGCLHALASLTGWAYVIQLWTRAAWPTHLGEALALSLLLVLQLLIAAVQFRIWVRDLCQRCPVCLERLLLSSTNGATESVLLSTSVTESICAHGHGVLVETRWNRQFRRESSPLEGLIQV